MFSLLSSRKIFATVALLFALAAFYQLKRNASPVGPTGFTFLRGSDTFDEQQPSSFRPQGPVASGPTLPPNPWEDEDGEQGNQGGNIHIASGPTLPPDPWTDEDGNDSKDGGNIKKTSGRTRQV